MPIRSIGNLFYALLIFDADGNEQTETDGSLLSDKIQQYLSQNRITDIFLMSHGWLGDVPGAIEQYDRWVSTMAGVHADIEVARQGHPGFRPLIVGLHWPSLPWGDETIPTGSGTLSPGDQPAIEALVDAFAGRIAETPTARAAIRGIVQEALGDFGSDALSSEARSAYSLLFQESGLATGDVGGRPGADIETFNPDAIIDDNRTQGSSDPTGGLLGAESRRSTILLAPLRQLSFWRMKDRACTFGETSGHALLARLQAAAPSAHVHLMGHSFGCIVASASIAGPPLSPTVLQPVDSLFLVQGALSLWSYADKIPHAFSQPGYFHRIVVQSLVYGPIVTTRSRFDKAVGRYYPMGARLGRQLLLTSEYPAYGGVGTFGIRGYRDTRDLELASVNFPYRFDPGFIYNLEASSVIRHGGGASGAHSDIAHAEVAHACWSAALMGNNARNSRHSVTPPSTTLGGNGDGSPAPIPSGSLPLPSSGLLQDESTRQQQRQEPPWQQRRQEFRQQQMQQQAPPQQQMKQEEPPRQQQRPESMQQQLQQQQEPPRQQQRPESMQQQLQQQQEPPRQAQRQEQQQQQVVAAQGEPGPRRWINAAFEDHEIARPLERDSWYTLALGVDLSPVKQAVGSAVLDETNLFPEGVTEEVLTVQLDSDDFEVSVATRPLRLPHQGKSHKARFDVRPRNVGECRLKATIHKQGNFVQQMDLTVPVTAPGVSAAAVTQVVARGRPPSAVGIIRPRDVGITTSPILGGYECTVFGAVAKHARLPLQPAELAEAVDRLRADLLKVVMHRDAAGAYVFQGGLNIPGDANTFALRTMARAGARLFQRLFYGPAAAADSHDVGSFLRRMATQPATRLKLQIVAERTPVPWGMLYLGDASDGAHLKWEYFLGMRHLVEQIPLQSGNSFIDSAMPSKPQLAVSINLNDNIDVTMGANHVAQQRAFWTNARQTRRTMEVIDRTKRAEVLRALKDGATADQILYFYCHAEAAGLDAPDGPDGSRLTLTDATVSLGDLALDAPTTIQLRGQPLVFINACESAEMSPAFYDGFVPYFMAKGARGVIGTECKTPALFAAVWAERFFEHFLNGDPLGEAFLALRQEFLKEYNNPLGLLYAVYCDGDTQIEPALGSG